MLTRFNNQILFDRILSQLNMPSCAERVGEISEDDLVKWGNAMARSGYRHNAETLQALQKYLAGYGLLIFGNVGVGKTFFFAAISGAIRQICPGMRKPKLWKIMSIAGKRMDEIRESLRELNDSEIVVDDIGSEPTYNEFGNRWEILPWIIEARLSSEMRTHFTTNLTAVELENRYGARTVDRLHEMAASVKFYGRSNRVNKPNKKAVQNMIGI